MSTLTVATVKSNSSDPPAFQNTSGTEIGRLCRAWVNFDGTGTVTIRAQYNVSSITDNGVGNYTVNLTTAMADTNYAVALGGSYNNSAQGRIIYQDDRLGAKTTTQVFVSADNGGAYSDSNQVAVAIFR